MIASKGSMGSVVRVGQYRPSATFAFYLPADVKSNDYEKRDVTPMETASSAKQNTGSQVNAGAPDDEGQNSNRLGLGGSRIGRGRCVPNRRLQRNERKDSIIKVIVQVSNSFK